MTAALADLPNDVATLRALVVAERARHASELAERDSRLERLMVMLQALRRAQFGRRSEKLDPTQLALALEDLKIAIAAAEAEEEKHNPTRSTPRRAIAAKRAPLPAHLPRVEQVLEPISTACPCCNGAMRGPGRAARRHPGPVSCAGDAPAQVRLPGLRGRGAAEASAGAADRRGPADRSHGGPRAGQKYANHLPLYRQWQILARQGIDIDRSNLALWVGRGAFLLAPVVDRMLKLLKGSAKLFCDETRAPVLDPGRGRTKPGYLWAIARDDRPWGGADPPAVVYLYAPGRGSEHALRHLAGFAGILQVDGYTGYNALADAAHRRAAALGLGAPAARR